MQAGMAGQRHETHMHQDLAIDATADGKLVPELQLLVLGIRPHRNDQPATGRELLQKRRRHFLGSGRDQDGIIGGAFGPAARAVADAELDVLVAELLQGALRPDSSGTISIVRTVLARGSSSQRIAV